MNTERTLEQQKIVTHYIREGPRKCTLVLSTGFGKAKIAIDIINQLSPKKVLILVDNTVLRDTTWKKEFEKFGSPEYFENHVELATYQLAYKWKKDEKDLSDYFIVADEVDFAADVPEFSKFFYEYSDNMTLGLTGFITDAKKEWFDNYLPVFKLLTSDQAQNKGILNNVKFVFVKYDLSKDPKGVKVEYTKNGVKKHFYQSENNVYSYHQERYAKLIAQKEANNNAFMRQEISYETYLNTLKDVDYKIKWAVQERSEVLLKSISSADMSKRLLEHIKKEGVNKTIVFSKRTAQSLIICGKERVYNGSVSPKVAEHNYNEFLKGNIRVLGVCDKINRGVNINNLNVAIFETFYGSDTKAVQRIGRMMRLDPDDMATIYVLLPYYMKEVSHGVYEPVETQQVVWARKMLRSTNVKFYSVWDYRMVKEKEKQ